MTRLTFLGTGGGRFATIYQTRGTGGILLDAGERTHIDPGPSALSMMARMGIDPAGTDHVIVSHCHTDHYGDAESIIEGMTRGGLRRRGSLSGSVSALEGVEGIGPAISSYHRSLPETVSTLMEGGLHSIGGIETEITFTDHSDPYGIGLRFHLEEGVLSYIGDTQLHERVIREHVGSDVVIVPLTRPGGDRVRGHLCTDDAIPLLDGIGATTAILTHMGVRIHRSGADLEARRIEEETGVKVIAAYDGMIVDLSELVGIHG